MAKMRMLTGMDGSENALRVVKLVSDMAAKMGAELHRRSPMGGSSSRVVHHYKVLTLVVP